MAKKNTWLWFGASVVALSAAAPAMAQNAASEDEIIVTAQRREQNIQDVPMTVTPITNEQIQELNIFSFEDIDQVVPGMELTNTRSGFGSSASLRGVAFDSQASAAPSVGLYFNDAPIDANYMFQSMYDIGQIEVLRGPQGTLRGAPAPGGAITLTTRRPDLNGYGGSMSVSLSDQNAANTSAAVNIPIIKDHLALRVAGLFDENDGAHVRNFNGDETSSETESWRASLRWAPTSNIDVNLTHQRLTADHVLLDEVLGNDDPVPPNSFFPGIPPYVNDPTITSRGFAVQDGPETASQESNITSLNVVWDLAGNRIVYAGGYQDNAFLLRQEQDPGNVILGAAFQTVDSIYKVETHELRLESTGDRTFDYVVGGYWQGTDTITNVAVPIETTAPIFGTLSIPPIITSSENKAVFGNLTYHLGERTDLSAGARYLVDQDDNGNDRDEWVYIASAAHHFTDNLMAYVTYGTSWRDGGNSVAISGSAVDPQYIDEIPPESSASLEIGVKSEWFNRTLVLNAALFRQDFENFVGRANDIYYDIDGIAVGQGGFTFGQDAIIEGAEMQLRWTPVNSWYADLNLFAGKSEYDGPIPCNDGNFDGTPDNIIPGVGTFPALGLATCESGDPVSSTPDWSLSLQSEYSFPLGAAAEAYVRGFYTYQPDNSNFGSGTDFTRDAYGILNLYAGVRGIGAGWEVGLWAKNVLDDDTILYEADSNYFLRGGFAYGAFYTPVNSGYHAISYVPEREVGISLRYAFGGG